MKSFGTDENVRSCAPILPAVGALPVREYVPTGAISPELEEASQDRVTEDARIERLVKTHAAMLVRVAASRLDSVADAEDAVQDVLCKVVASRIVFSSEEHERAWLVRAVLNRASDLRKRAARRNVPLDEGHAATLVGERDVPQTSPVLEAMRRLPEKYAAPLHLHYYEGYGLKEIGAMLAVPPATVATRLARGRARLERMLKEEQS